MTHEGIAWIATVTTLEQARSAAEAGADVIAAQCLEAGGHCGSIDAASSERNHSGLFALLPAIIDAVDLPAAATGGIADVETPVYLGFGSAAGSLAA